MKPGERLISLDFFRGATIALMIVVNNPGSWSYVLPPFRHAEWHGCTPTDLVFPFFLFIVGVAMAFSFAKRLEQGHSLWPLYRRIIRRTITLILLGIFLALYWDWDFSTVRIPGVLQRIGVCYFFASLIVLNFRTRGQILWIAGLLLGYWAIMTLVPYPGRGTDPWAFGNNLALYVDRLVFGRHMWKPDIEPEGLISTIPAITQVLIGYLTGQWIRSRREPLEKTNLMFIAANVLIVAGLFWAYWMPINKQLWTSSYVLYTSGIAIHSLSISYWLIDIKQKRKGLQPFIVYGSNAILAFFGSSLMAKTLYKWHITLSSGETISVTGYLFKYILSPIFGNWIGSLVHPILYFLIWWAILSWFYRRKIFIRV
jgi:predicted acyltransferase